MINRRDTLKLMATAAAVAILPTVALSSPPRPKGWHIDREAKVISYIGDDESDLKTVLEFYKWILDETDDSSGEEVLISRSTDQDVTLNDSYTLEGDVLKYVYDGTIEHGENIYYGVQVLDLSKDQEVIGHNYYLDEKPITVTTPLRGDPTISTYQRAMIPSKTGESPTLKIEAVVDSRGASQGRRYSEFSAPLCRGITFLAI